MFDIKAYIQDQIPNNLIITWSLQSDDVLWLGSYIHWMRVINIYIKNLQTEVLIYIFETER